MDCAPPEKYEAMVEGVALRPSWESMSATSDELTLPELSRSSTLKDSRMLCSNGAGTLDSASVDVDRVARAGRDGRSDSRGTGGLVVRSASRSKAGGGVAAGLSKRAAMDEVEGRIVLWVEDETFLEGDLGTSGAIEDLRVFIHGGWFGESLAAAAAVVVVVVVVGGGGMRSDA